MRVGAGCGIVPRLNGEQEKCKGKGRVKNDMGGRRVVIRRRPGRAGFLSSDNEPVFSLVPLLAATGYNRRLGKRMAIKVSMEGG